MSLIAELRRRNVIRVAIAYSITAWLIAQVAELGVDSFGSPDWVMKTILLLLALGLPFAILFAWAFELTPEGLKREQEIDRSQSITRETGRKLNYTIIGALGIALVFSIATHRWTGAGDETEEPVELADTGDKSIAVLPFVNMSDDKDNEYFSDGISEELLNVLVKVDGLRVASRTSSFSFKGTGTPIPEIANALKVEHVLEGSVRKAGNMIRITAQLIDVKTDSHLWSDTYDRKLEDIFVIQDEISAHIVDALKVALGAGNQEIVRTQSKPTNNLAAYEDYLRGRHFWQRRGGDNIRKAIELLGNATRADPGFARAWSSLAAAHITMPSYSGESREDHYPVALEYASKALDLDPSIAEAHAVIGDILRVEKRWVEAESHYRKAIALEPKNSTGYLWYSEQMACLGFTEKALANAMKAFELDPFHAGTTSMLSFSYLLTGDPDQAQKYAQSARDLGHPQAIYQLIQREIDDGNFDEASRLLNEDTAGMDADEVADIELYIEAFRDADKIDAYLEHGANDPTWSTHFLAMDSIRLGKVDKGINLLLTNAADGSDWQGFWLPDMAALWQDPRFGDLLERDGIIRYWDDHGWPPQCEREDGIVTCN